MVVQHGPQNKSITIKQVLLVLVLFFCIWPQQGWADRLFVCLEMGEEEESLSTTTLISVAGKNICFGSWCCVTIHLTHSSAIQNH